MALSQSLAADPAVSAPHDPAVAQPMPLVLEPPVSTFRWPDFRELWSYRELLYFLTWRDIKVRYKQTILGGVWALLQPLAMMVIFTLVISRLAGLRYAQPYPLVVYSGLLPWTLFASAMGASSDSVVGSANLVTKVYFPRLILPVAAAGSYLVDMLVASSLLAGLMAYYGVTPTAAVALLPLFTLLALASAIAVGIWLTALNVRYRDIRYLVPFVTQIWLLASPVAYQTSSVPSAWRLVYGLNPIAGVIQGFRWALIGGPRPGAVVLVSSSVVIALLASGVAYFQRVERTFADVV
ncbi:MAG: ABC transporter permease [Gaiellaceae bacterium]